jgi:hypothetical protein
LNFQEEDKGLQEYHYDQNRKIDYLKINQYYCSAHVSCVNIGYMDILSAEHIGQVFILLF